MKLDFRSDSQASGSRAHFTPGAGARRLVSTFSDDEYRQPVLTEESGKPLSYRRAQVDVLTEQAVGTLQNAESNFIQQSSGTFTSNLSFPNPNGSSSEAGSEDTATVV